MAVPIIQLPLDKDGTSIDNKIIDEPHTLTHRTFRAIAPNYGAFFTRSVTIVDNATQKPLGRDQFRFAEMYELPTAEFGKEICAIIVITDTSVSDTVSITYQAVGGQYSSPATAIVKQIEALKLDNRPVSWPFIMNKPDDYAPSYHRHDAGDLYGMEIVVHAIDRLSAAINLGDAVSHDAIYQYIDRENNKLSDVVGKLTASLMAHVNNKENPHEVTAAQLNVLTAPVVERMVQVVTQAIKDHSENTGNPHQTDAHQVGTYNKGEIDKMFADLRSLLTDAINRHVKDTSNPHQTDAHQTGTYNKGELDQLLQKKQDLQTALNDDNFVQRFDARLAQRFTFVTTSG